MATDYSRSERFIREATSRIDKDLKAELREIALTMWMACYTQDEISGAVGYSQPAVAEFLKNLQDVRNGTGAVSDKTSENLQLTSETLQEFDENEEEDTNSLGTYHLDKRLLIRANHLDEAYTPPIYNI